MSSNCNAGLNSDKILCKLASVQALYSFQCQSCAWILPGFQSEPFPMTKSVLVNCWAEIRVVVEADEMDGEWSSEPISTGNSTHWPELHFGCCSCLEHSGTHWRLFQRRGLHLYFFAPKLSDISPKYGEVMRRIAASHNPLIPSDAPSLDKISPFSGGKYEGKLWN